LPLLSTWPYAPHLHFRFSFKRLLCLWISSHSARVVWSTSKRPWSAAPQPATHLRLRTTAPPAVRSAMSSPRLYADYIIANLMPPLRGFRKRIPSPSPFSSMNSIPADSNVWQSSFAACPICLFFWRRYRERRTNLVHARCASLRVQIEFTGLFLRGEKECKRGHVYGRP
jgi:hypothetical protein